MYDSIVYVLKERLQLHLWSQLSCQEILVSKLSDWKGAGTHFIYLKKRKKPTTTHLYDSQGHPELQKPLTLSYHKHKIFTSQVIF